MVSLLMTDPLPAMAFEPRQALDPKLLEQFKQAEKDADRRLQEALRRKRLAEQKLNQIEKQREEMKNEMIAELRRMGLIPE